MLYTKPITYYTICFGTILWFIKHFFWWVSVSLIDKFYIIMKKNFLLYFINLSILWYHCGFVEKGDKVHKFEIWDIRSVWMERRCKNKWDFEGIWEEIESKLIKYYKRININLIGFLSYFDTKNSTFVTLVNVLFIDDRRLHQPQYSITTLFKY